LAAQFPPPLAAQFGMNENYGVKGRIHTLEQRKLWNVGLEQLPNRDSFDVEFSPSGQTLRIQNYNMAGTATGSQHFIYDNSGKVIRCVECDRTGQETRTSEFLYQSKEGRVVTTSKVAGVVTGCTIEAYKENLLHSFVGYDDEGRMKREKVFEYSGSKLTKSDSKYYLPDGALYEHWLTDYDSESRVARTYGLKSNGTPLGDGKYVYEYDDDGRLSKLWTFNEFEDDNIASSVTMYEYTNDDFGNWIERRRLNQFRNCSQQSKQITTRKLTYYAGNIFIDLEPE
jgi:hypothetical protein